MSIISVHNLSKKFGDITAVDDLNLEVKKGEVLGFLGPNGAGKTTTIRMLAGIIAPTSGYAEIAGQRTDGNIERLHEVIGLLTETPALYDRLTAERNLKYFAGFYPIVGITPQVEKYLRLMGLWERRKNRAGTFSKGMKQRLALARALLHEPQVLFLDEPTSGLDPEAAQEVREMVKNLSSQGRTIFLSTHNLTEAEQLCHRIAVIRTKLLVLDTSENLRNRFFRQEVNIRLENPSITIINAVKRLDFVDDVEEKDNRLIVRLTEPDKNHPELVKEIVDAGGRILGVSEAEHHLEEIYLKLIREEKENGI
ncbi:MAG TPA: ABC transporter ATP-binding protein [Dehalococcoidia bacterium]|nr:ABC transporter ATP-binding protein [Dehalococcoidia bacterium]